SPGSSFIRGFLLPPKNHGHSSFGIELDYHVGAFIDGPDVVVLIHADRMRVRPRVQVVTDFPQILTVGAKLEYLRCGRSVSRSCNVPAIENENMSLGINGDTGCFAKMQISRQLEKVGHRIIGDFRYGLLGEEHRTQYQKQGDDEGFHKGLL